MTMNDRERDPHVSADIQDAVSEATLTLLKCSNSLMPNEPSGRAARVWTLIVSWYQEVGADEQALDIMLARLLPSIEVPRTSSIL